MTKYHRRTFPLLLALCSNIYHIEDSATFGGLRRQTNERKEERKKKGFLFLFLFLFFFFFGGGNRNENKNLANVGKERADELR